MKQIDIRDGKSPTKKDASQEVIVKSLALLDQELEDGTLSPEDYLRVRDQYLSQAARWKSEGEKQVPVRGVRNVSSGRVQNRRSSMIVSVLLGLIVLVGIAVTLLGNSKERQGDQTLTGNGAPQSSSELIAQAGISQQQGDLVGALKLYDQVLQKDGRNLEALSQRGWTLYLASRAVRESQPASADRFVDDALNNLNAALVIDGNYLPARAWRGVVRSRALNDKSGAREDFDVYLANAPENDPMRAMITAARRSLS